MNSRSSDARSRSLACPRCGAATVVTTRPLARRLREWLTAGTPLRQQHSRCPACGTQGAVAALYRRVRPLPAPRGSCAACGGSAVALTVGVDPEPYLAGSRTPGR